MQADILAYQNGFATGAERAGWGRRALLAIKRNKAASIGAAVVLLLSVAFTAKVVSEARRAERALGSLRKAAPSLAAQAQSLVAEQKLDDAVEKLDFALAIEPDNADYALRRANYLQAALHLRAAAEAYRSILRRGPNDAAASSLALCEKLLAAHGDGDLPGAALDELRTAIVAQHREAEAIPLAARLGKGKEAALAVLRERLGAWQKLPGWSDTPEDRIRMDSKGRIWVEISGLPISDLSPLLGLYVEMLLLNQTKVTDLRPLAGMRLQMLSADQLTQLHSLGGLEGAPLVSIFITRAPVSDLSPLLGSPLRDLRMSETLVSDLAPVRNCPLETLRASYTAIQSIEVLRGKMMKEVHLDGCLALTDISPLKGCATLEELTLPPNARDIEFLRAMPRLKKLSYGPAAEAETAAEFWKAYDIRKAAGKQ